MKKQTAQVVMFITLLLVLISLVYGGYHLNRWVNWRFGYENMVKQTITDVVKQECLK